MRKKVFLLMVGVLAVMVLGCSATVQPTPTVVRPVQDSGLAQGNFDDVADIPVSDDCVLILNLVTWARIVSDTDFDMADGYDFRTGAKFGSFEMVTPDGVFPAVPTLCYPGSETSIFELNGIGEDGTYFVTLRLPKCE